MRAGGSMNASWPPSAWASPPRGGNGFAWMIALVPLFLLAANLLLAQLHQPFRIPGPVTWAAYAMLVVADRQMLRNAGETPPSLWWLLFVPVYLWKRATLLGQGRSIFWVMLVALLPSGLIGLAMPRPLPDCEASRLTALRLFNTLDSVKRQGVIGVHIDTIHQLAASPAQNACMAVVHGTDGHSYDLDYTNIRTDAGSYVQVRLHAVQRI
jgi:hypothetical protein